MKDNEEKGNLTISKKEYYIDMLSNTSIDKTIKVTKSGELFYLAICDNTQSKITIETTDQQATNHIYIICMSKDKQKTSLQINSSILHSKSSTTINLLTLAGDKAQIDIDGGVRIGPGIEKAEGYLTEKNIILGKNTQINVVPILDVHSNDVQASHGASIARLDAQDLFYLRAKGLTKEEGGHLMIQGHIDSILSNFSHDGNLNEIALIKKHIVDYIL